jgi:transcriptional regulator with XRE-family HTH domain
MDIVGENIRQIRRARGLLQKELADRAEMNPSNLSKLERGEYTWTKENLRRLAEALNVGVGAFFADNPATRPMGGVLTTIKTAGASSSDSGVLGAMDAKLDRILMVLEAAEGGDPPYVGSSTLKPG